MRFVVLNFLFPVVKRRTKRIAFITICNTIKHAHRKPTAQQHIFSPITGGCSEGLGVF